MNGRRRRRTTDA